MKYEQTINGLKTKVSKGRAMLKILLVFWVLISMEIEKN